MKVRLHILFGFCVSVVLLQPWLTARYYRFMWHRNVYPPDGDSIAIPIVSNFLAWLIWAPLLIYALWRAFRQIAAPPHALAWDRTRPAKSGVVTLVCLAAAGLAAEDIPQAVAWKNWAEVAYSIAWCVAWLVVRAAALSPKNPAKAPTPALRLA